MWLKLDQANSTSEEDVEAHHRAVVGTAIDRALPMPWRVELPYSLESAHAGFCCDGGRFVFAGGAAPSQSDRAHAVDTNGEVLPAATAERVWPGAFLLATYLHEARLCGTMGSVIELGAGLGLPGLAAWAGGAREVVLTDLEENLTLLASSCEQNGATDVRCEAVDWTLPLPDRLARTRGREPWEYIIAADCVFWERLFVPLLQTLGLMVRGDDRTVVLLTITNRLDRAERFSAAALAEGWTLERLHVHRAVIKTPTFEHTWLYRLRRRGPSTRDDSAKRVSERVETRVC